MAKRYWYVILVYIIMQFSVFLGAPLLYALFSLNAYQANGYWSVISFIIGLIVILLLMRPDMRSERNTLASGPGVSLGWIVVGFFMAIFSQAAAVWIEMNLFGIRQASENTEVIMDLAKQAPLFVIIPALIAPILEEIIFRKIIFGTLYKRTGFIIAALISSVIFGIIHGEPKHLLIYASMGFVFAYLYMRTKRIIVPIAVHMALNSLVIYNTM